MDHVFELGASQQQASQHGLVHHGPSVNDISQHGLIQLEGLQCRFHCIVIDSQTDMILIHLW